MEGFADSAPHVHEEHRPALPWNRGTVSKPKQCSRNRVREHRHSTPMEMGHPVSGQPLSHSGTGQALMRAEERLARSKLIGRNRLQGADRFLADIVGGISILSESLAYLST